jgi:hypothetical protein
MEFLLVIPSEVNIRLAKSNYCLVLLAKLKHFLDKFGVWEEEISLLLQDLGKVDILVKLMRCDLRHSLNRISVTISSNKVRYRLKYVFPFGITLSNYL